MHPALMTEAKDQDQLTERARPRVTRCQLLMVSADYGVKAADYASSVHLRVRRSHHDLRNLSHPNSVFSRDLRSSSCPTASVRFEQNWMFAFYLWKRWANSLRMRKELILLDLLVVVTRSSYFQALRGCCLPNFSGSWDFVIGESFRGFSLS